mgnify:CR=1 FL=1
MSYDINFINSFNEYYPFERYIVKNPKKINYLFDDVLLCELFIPSTEIKPIMHEGDFVGFTQINDDDIYIKLKTSAGEIRMAYYDFNDHIREEIRRIIISDFGAYEWESLYVEHEEDDEDFFETIDTDHLRKIDVSEIEENDYICIDGESSFCQTSYLKIFKIAKQVTMEDDKIVPFLILIDEDGDSWSSLDGSCVNNPNSMYSVVGYYRYDENYSREKERENTIETTTDSEEELKSPEDFFNQEWVKKLFEKAID